MIFVESGFTVAECWNLCHQKVKKSKFFSRETVPISVSEKNLAQKNENRPVQEMPKGVSNLNQAAIDILKQGLGWSSSVEKYNKYYDEGPYNYYPVQFVPDFRIATYQLGIHG